MRVYPAGRMPARLRKDRYLILLILPGLIYYALFCYKPMYGLLIAFKNFKIRLGILDSQWATPWYKWFMEFFGSYYFVRVVRNTLLLNVYSLLFSFPVPILFAVLLNELRSIRYKRFVQTVSYMPHFISTVVACGIVVNLLSPHGGVVNLLLAQVGVAPINFLREPGWFRPVYIVSGIWQGFGWNSIIYIAAISGIDMELYEAARMDGANRFRQVWHVTLPGIANTILILLILSVGSLMSVGYEKILLLYDPSTYETADVISTFVYRRGVVGAQYSFGAAVGLFNSAVNLALLVSVNQVCRRLGEVSIW